MTGLIKWLIKTVPGVSYSEDKLIDWFDAEKNFFDILHDIFELKKHKPCPMVTRDAFREEPP